jgi:hypothetical protein
MKWALAPLELPTAVEDKKLSGWQNDHHEAPLPAHESSASQGSLLARLAPRMLEAPWSLAPCSFLEPSLALLGATILKFAG